MTPEQAKQICIEAHKGQWRRGVVVNDLLYSTVITQPEVYAAGHTILKDGNRLYYDSTNDVWKVSEPYHTHPIAVADMMTTDEEKIVAYLHDVIEDCEEYFLESADFTICNNKGMNMYLGREMFCVLTCITHATNLSYDLYINRISQNRLATKVKLADIFHNIQTAGDKQKAKYMKAIPVLLNLI